MVNSGTVVIAFGIGICVGAITIYAISQSQFQTLQTQVLMQPRPYHYEVERDGEGRLSGLSYLPG